MSKRNRKQTQAQNETVEQTVADINEGMASMSDDDAIDAALAAISAETTTPVDVSAVEVIDIEAQFTDDTAMLEAVEEEADGKDLAVVEENEDEIAMAMADIEEAGAEIEAAETELEIEHVIASETDQLLMDLLATEDAPQPTSQAADADATDAVTKAKRTPATPPAPKREFHTVAAIDPNTLKANLDATDAKKVNEKAQNLIQAIEQGKKLSRYTSVAIKRLIADGKITSKSLVQTYEAEGLTIGTARAQAQQMTALFKIFGVAQPDSSASRELVLADVNLAQELARLAA